MTSIYGNCPKCKKELPMNIRFDTCLICGMTICPQCSYIVSDKVNNRLSQGYRMKGRICKVHIDYPTITP